MTVDYDSRDLEYIELGLQLAAIELTPEPGSTFTLVEMLEAMQRYAIVDVDPKDALIVLENHAGFRRMPGKRWRFR